MTKEKLASLTKYFNGLKDKLAEKQVPGKHNHHVQTYHNFLKNEIAYTGRQLEAAKLEGTK